VVTTSTQELPRGESQEEKKLAPRAESEPQAPSEKSAEASPPEPLTQARASKSEVQSQPRTAAGVYFGLQEEAYEIPEDPFMALKDMHLPEEYTAILSPCLQSFGFLVQHADVMEEISGEQHRFTLVTNGRDNRYLFHIQDQILSNPSRMNRVALKDVLEVFTNRFGAETRFFVFHETPPNAMYKYVFHELEKQKGISISFISFTEIRDLRNLVESLQWKILRIHLSLEEVSQNVIREPEGSRKALADLEQDDQQVNKIVAMLARRASRAPVALSAKGFIRNLINETRWPDEWKSQRIGGLTGDPETDARDLIDYAIGQGTNPDYAEETILGGLLIAMLQDVGGEDRNLLHAMISDYNLGKI
jgi:hypothetical protein